MTADDRDRILERAFLASVSSTGSERAGALDDRRDDPTLRADVESLLRHHERASVLDAPITPEDTGFLDESLPEDEPEAPGTTIGSYTIVRTLGSGGMGAVYLAEQTEPVRRRVAVKLIRPGVASPDALARFDTEREAMALLDSPYVARMYDAGATDDDRPFFAMEFVEGVPITHYCAANDLPGRDRLSLFLQVCAGVSHAHQRGVIHRDLKPSNVLVSETDGGPQAKIIDFGVAKALDPLSGRTPLETIAGLVIGTPAYMSPEQATGGARAVDSRSDVYSLGVVLHEMLTGSTPRDPGAPEAHARAAGAPAPSPKLPGEIVWILDRALATEPEARYQSASELADDIRRHLAGDAVLAGPPGVRYRLVTLARKHRTAAAAISVILVSLAVSSVVSVRALWRETEARQAAEANAAAEARSARVSGAVRDFMRGLFLIDAGDPRSRASLTVAAAQERALERLDTAFQNLPHERALVLATFGGILLETGRTGSADSLLSEAVAVFRRTPDADAAEFAQCLRNLASARRHTNPADALELGREARRVIEAAYGPRHPLVGTALSDLGLRLHDANHLGEAAEVLGRAVDVLCDRELLRADQWDPLACMRANQNLALVLMTEGRYDGATRAIERSLAPELTVEDGAGTFERSSRELLGLVHLWSGRAREAEPHLAEALAKWESRRDPSDPVLAMPRARLAIALAHLGAFDRSDSLLLLAEEAIDEAGGPSTRFGAWIAYIRGEHHRIRGDPEAARSAYEIAVARFATLDAPNERWLARAEHRLGVLAAARGETAQAERCFRLALARRIQAFRPGHPETIETEDALTAVLALGANGQRP